MSARLAALGHNKIHTNVGSPRRISRARDGPKHYGTCVLGAARVTGRVPLPQGHNSATSLKRCIEPARLIIDEGQIHAETVAAAGSGDIAGKHLPHLGFRHVHESDESHRALARQSGKKLRCGTTAEWGGNYGITQAEALGEHSRYGHRISPNAAFVIYSITSSASASSLGGSAIPRVC